MGKLFFRYGTMGSSKSAHLLMTGFNFREKGINAIYLKPSIDQRDGNKIVSRIGLSADCVNIKTDEKILPHILNKDIRVIMADEVQFFSKSQIEEIAEIVDKYDILAICYGLKIDARGILFEGSKRLLELADTIEEIKSACSCGKKATMNARFNEIGQIYLPETQVELGGNDKYIALCRKCWVEEQRKGKLKKLF